MQQFSTFPNNRAWDEPERVRSLFEALRGHMKATGDLLHLTPGTYERFYRNDPHV